MNIIGIHDGHNASVALYRKGELSYALQEERISREKNASGFPVKAFYKLLEDNSLKFDDIYLFFLVSNHMIVNPRISTRDIMKKRFEKGDNMKRVLKDWLRNTKLYEVKKNRLNQNKIKECEKNGIPTDRLKIVEHHSAHANTAYYCSPFEHDDKVLVVTSDGGGDKLSCTVNIGEKGRIKRKNVIPDSDSLDKLYSGVTYYNGP